MNIKLLVQPTEANMFGISLKPKSVARPLRTIEQEVKATRARYNEYLKTTKNNYIAQRGDVQIHQPHTMPGDSYNILKGSINDINKIAQKANKAIIFEDGRTIFKLFSPAMQNVNNPIGKRAFTNSIIVTVMNKRGILNPKEVYIDASPRSKEPLLKQVSNVLGEMITGKKEANFDKELGLR